MHPNFCSSLRSSSSCKLAPVEASKQHDEFDYYNLMFPSSQYDIILELANKGLCDDRQRLLVKDEFIHIIGIRLAIALESKRGGLRTYFSEVCGRCSEVILKESLERLSRFQNVMQHF